MLQNRTIFGASSRPRVVANLRALRVEHVQPAALLTNLMSGWLAPYFGAFCAKAVHLSNGGR
jgi:hypothetical protein